MKMQKKIIAIYLLIHLFILFVGPSSYIHAEDALSLKSAVDTALKSNPEILAAKKNYEAAKAKIPQELVPPEDPMLEYSYDEMRSGVEGYMGKPMRSYAVSQKMPFPTKLLLRSSMASKDAKILYEAYREKERDIIARVKSAYFELWFVEKALN